MSVEHFDWSALASLSNAETFAVRESELEDGTHRLESSFYGSVGYRSIKALENSGFQLMHVGDCANVFNPPIFKRCYVYTEDTGVPYLTGSSLLEARPQKEVYLSKTQTPELTKLLIDKNAVLITDSGSIGHTVLATADIDGWASTNNLIRVISRNTHEIPQEFLYTFFQSELGQYLLTRNTYGSVIEHIDPHHVKELKFPLFPRSLRQRIGEFIQHCSEARVRANSLLDEAQELMKRQGKLPDLDKVTGSNIIAQDGDCLTFTTSKSEIAQRKWGNRRLDATFYHPVTDALRSVILNHEQGCELNSLLIEVKNSTLRKRDYVHDPEMGVALMGGKQLLQTRPQEVKYLSNALTRNLKKEVVSRGWTLVSCGGTLGRTLYVHRNYEGTAFSQHVMRLIPDETKVFPGFIYAFLSSPYGQTQIQQRGYGSVIPEIRDFQFKSIAIRLPKDKGEGVHDKVVEAFELRADALESENRAIALFMDALERGRAYIEQEWGTEY